MSKEVPQVPSEAREGKGIDREGLYIIDRPLRVKTCRRCWQPLCYKHNRLYCPTCKKFRTINTSQWINHHTNIKFVTKECITELLKE